MAIVQRADWVANPVSQPLTLARALSYVGAQGAAEGLAPWGARGLALLIKPLLNHIR